jgi:protein SCO1/2
MKSVLYKYRVFLVFFAILERHFVSFQRLKPTKSLPIYNPSDVNPELVDSTVQYISKYHTLLIFVYQQNGKNYAKDYEEKIYSNDFFFTCTSICPKMISNLVDVQKQ